MGWMHLIFIGCGAFFLLDSVKSCPALGESFGNITEDQYLEVGSFLKLECSLHVDVALRNSISKNELIVKFKGKQLPDVKSVDNLTVEYVVPNATEGNSGYYGCFVKHPDYDVPKIVCTSYVAIGYKPLPVESFSCISEEYLNLTCSWKAPFNPVPTQYQLYDYFFRPTVNRSCPAVLNPTSCQFRVDTEPPYLKHYEKLHFILVGKNKLGVNKQFITIDHYNIIRPGKPVFRLCTNITQNSLFMRWNAPKGLSYGEFPNGLLYEVKYYSVSTELPGTKEITKYVSKDLEITIDDLVPHTLYEFQVRVRLNISGNEYYWSDASKHTEKTKSDVPYLAPEVTRSAYDWQILSGNRSITLYWKAIPSEFENGKNFRYRIRYHLYHTLPIRYKRDVSMDINYETNETRFTFENMDTESAYIFNITAVNEVGKSMNESSVIVDKNDKLLQGPKDIMVVSHEDGNYSLTWKDFNRETTHFTVFWCKTLKSRPATCDGSIEWRYVRNTSQYLLLSNRDTNYQFAVAANNHHQTSGMVWAPCIALSYVHYKVEEMRLTPKNADSLKVQWSLTCKAIEKVIKKYRIYYCALPMPAGKCPEDLNLNPKCDAGWNKTDVNDSSKTEFIIRSLTPYTCYFSFMQVLTNSGWGQNSSYAYESTMATAPGDPPRNVVATPVQINEYTVELEVSFESPLEPNGVVTKYKVYYADATPEDPMEDLPHVEAPPEDRRVRIKRVHYYKNYSIEVSACVHQSCSNKSDPVYVYTGISNPYVVNQPHYELSESEVNITWDPPHPPNGPVDYYEIELYSNDTGRSQHYNSSSSSLTLKRECDSAESDRSMYEFKVRAVNLENGHPLYGEYSKSSKMVFCPTGGILSWSVITGIVVSLIFAIVVFVAIFVFVYRCRKEYKARKNIDIKLPARLETGFGDHLNSFDKLKNGLQRSGPDSSIPCDQAYERLCSFSQGHQNGGWTESDTTSTGNNSGESNQSGFSSADTTRTVVSMDSSAEHKCYAGESDSNRSQSEEGTAEDMGGIADCLTPQFVNSGNMTFSKCFVKPRILPTPLINCAELGILPSYSKFGNVPISDNPYSPYWADNVLQSLKKIKSLPSLHDDDESVSEIQPYSKVGLTRSNTHLCESDRPYVHNAGYSRFGMVYAPNNYQNNAQVFSCFIPPSGPLPILPIFPHNKGKVKRITETKDKKIPNDAYSKFGIVGTASSINKNYVPLGNATAFGTGARTFAAPVQSVSAGCCDPSRQTRTDPHLESDEDDDPRSLMEIMASDTRFCPPVVGLSESEDRHILSLDTQNEQSVRGEVNDSWKHCNGNVSPTPSLEDNEDEGAGFDLKTNQTGGSVALSNYVPLNELSMRILSHNSIACSADAPVASV